MHSRLRGNAEASPTLSGNQLKGADAGTSDISMRHPPTSVSNRRNVTRAFPNGLPLASNTNSRSGQLLNTTVLSFRRAGQTPME